MADKLSESKYRENQMVVLDKKVKIIFKNLLTGKFTMLYYA